MNLEKVGRNLKKARKQKELTQVQVAEKVDIHPNYYAKIERGEIQPALDTLEKIFKVLGVKSSDILPF